MEVVALMQKTVALRLYTMPLMQVEPMQKAVTLRLLAMPLTEVALR